MGMMMMMMMTPVTIYDHGFELKERLSFVTCWCTLPPLNLQCASTHSSYGLIKFCFFLSAFVQNH